MAGDDLEREPSIIPYMAGTGSLKSEVSYSSAPSLFGPTVYSLFIGVGLAITAVPILGQILRELGLTRTEIGVMPWSLL